MMWSGPFKRAQIFPAKAMSAKSQQGINEIPQQYLEHLPQAHFEPNKRLWKKTDMKDFHQI